MEVIRDNIVDLMSQLNRDELQQLINLADDMRDMLLVEAESQLLKNRIERRKTELLNGN